MINKNFGFKNVYLNPFLVAPSEIKVSGDPANNVLVAGQNLKLTCEMKGTPRPFIYWVLNGRLVTYDSIRRIVNGTRLNLAREEIHFSRIEFTPLRRFDGGEYTCFASNYGGVIEKKYSLDVNCEYASYVYKYQSVLFVLVCLLFPLLLDNWN